MIVYKPGDYVKLEGQDSVAEVLSVKGNELEVMVGVMKIKVKATKVTKAEAPEEEFEEEVENIMESSGINTKEKLMHFKFELDVRGKMKEEVITELSTWVDDAILLGVSEAKVVHGRGNGILKDTVRSFLRKYKEVQSVGDDEKGKGGDFVTVVKFKI
jgi:DNA mismatch repair protein MutS2